MRLIALLPALVLLVSCREEPRRAEAAPKPPVAVQVAAAAAAEWPVVYEATGTVRARTAATISSKVMGYVQQVSVQVGDRVREGQVLVTIDARDLETNVRRADAARDELQSAFPEADSAVAGAKAQFDLAQATFKRIDGLARQKSVSSQELDEATARLKGAQAAYEMARAKRSQLNAKLAQVEQERTAASIVRGYSRIAAPFAGVVTAKSVEPGNLAAPGAPLLTIERDGAYRLEVAVEESKLAAIGAGQPVQVAMEALGKTISARVAEIVPAVDASSRAYTVKIDLPSSRQIRSGMFGRALFSLGKRQVLVVPVQALVERGQLQAVYVVEENAAHNRLVTVGQRSGAMVEVLSGLNSGEKVVSPVPPTLADGARVEARP